MFKRFGKIRDQEKRFRQRGGNTLVLVSIVTSMELILVERMPAMNSPAKGLKKLRPGSASFSKRPHLSTTPTFAWPIHPQNKQNTFPILSPLLLRRVRFDFPEVNEAVYVRKSQRWDAVHRNYLRGCTISNNSSRYLLVTTYAFFSR